MANDTDFPNELDRSIVESVLKVLLDALTREIEDLAKYRNVAPELVWRNFKEMLQGQD